MSSSSSSKNVLRPFLTVRGFLEETTLPLTLLDRAVFLLLASWMDAENGDNAYPGAERLAAVLGALPASVATSLRRLRDFNLIVATVDRPHRGRSQCWEIGPLFKGAMQKAPLHTTRKRGSTDEKAPLGNRATDKTDRDRGVDESQEAEAVGRLVAGMAGGFSMEGPT